MFADDIIFSSTRNAATGAEIDAIGGENFADLFITERDKNGKWSEPVKLGATINTFLSSNDSSVDENTTYVFLRTSYTVRDDILISLDMTWNKMPISQPKQTLNGSTGTISVEYYF